MAKLQLTLLGGFRARFDSGGVVPLPTRKSQGLLAYLALNTGQPQSREKLASTFWSETPEEHARHSLRQTILSVKKALASVDKMPLVLQGDEVALDISTVDVDAKTFERLSYAGDPDSLKRASELYTGGFLDGFTLKEEPFEEWAASERSRLAEIAIDTFSRLLRHYRERSEFEAGIQTALRLLALDPLQENVHRALMELYVAAGRREAALRQYQICATVLKRDLGIEPQAETRRLCQQILKHSPATMDERVDIELPSQRSVLIVEDDPVTRTLLSDFLTGAGYEVVVAEDGADALVELGRRRFDVILSDVNMPNLGGLKLLEVMGQKGIQTPAVFLTALEDEELEVRGLELGAADYIKKPIRKDVLLLRVQKALRH